MLGPLRIQGEGILKSEFGCSVSCHAVHYQKEVVEPESHSLSTDVTNTAKIPNLCFPIQNIILTFTDGLVLILILPSGITEQSFIFTLNASLYHQMLLTYNEIFLVI